MLGTTSARAAKWKTQEALANSFSQLPFFEISQLTILIFLTLFKNLLVVMNLVL